MLVLARFYGADRWVAFIRRTGAEARFYAGDSSPKRDACVCFCDEALDPSRFIHLVHTADCVCLCSSLAVRSGNLALVS